MPEELQPIATYLNSALEQRSITLNYVTAIQDKLVALKNELSHREWRVTSLLGIWVKGEPTHIKKLKALLESIEDATTVSEILKIQTKVQVLLNDMPDNSRRHPATQRFYRATIDSLNSIPYENSIVSEPAPPSYFEVVNRDNRLYTATPYPSFFQLGQPEPSAPTLETINGTNASGSFM